MHIGKFVLPRITCFALFVPTAVLFSPAAFGQLSITSPATTYTITFDGTLSGVSNGAFTGAGFQASPSSGQLNSNAWASTGMSDGSLALGGTQTSGDHARGTANGNVTTGGFYCFNAAAIGSRSIGIQPAASDWTPGTLTLRVKNILGTALTTLDVAYELWVNNNENRSSSFDLSYSTNDVTYTSIPALDYTSSAGSDGLGFVLNNRSTMITGLNIVNNGYIYLRWSSNDISGNGNRDEFALDDISVTGNRPNLAASGLAAFGAQCINGGPYGPNTFTISGTNLTAVNVTVGAVSGLSFSTTSTGTYANSLSITHGTGSFSQVIYVKFTPALVANYSNNIAIGGGGAALIQMAASGSGINTAPTVSTGASLGITSTSATLAGQITANGCSAITNYGIEYSTTAGFITGTGTVVSGTNLSGGAFSCGLSSLTPCTTYYFKARATNGGGTGTGAQGQFTTSAIVTPTAIVASSASSSDFIANWNPVPGASSYQLDVSTSPTFSIPSLLTTTEGFNNGATPPAGWTFTGISNTLTSASNYGVGAPSIEFDGNNDQIVTPTLSSPASSLSFWVKDYFSLFSTSLRVEGYNGSSWTTIDNIQSLPTTGNTQTYTGLTASGFIRFRFTYSVSFIGILAFDDVSYTCLCGSTTSFVPGYNNLAVSGTSQVVTGLQPSTTYYYRVRAIGGACAATSNGNTITVQTGHPIYYSQTSGNVSSPIWSITPTGTAGPATFSAATSMVVQNGNIVDNTATMSLENLTVTNGGTLNIHSGSKITVNGTSANFAGTLVADDNSTLALNGIANTALSGVGTISLWDLTVNTSAGTQVQVNLNIRGTLLLNSGSFNASATTVKLVSTVAGTGRLGPVASGAAYVGAMTVERYIPAGHTNWRMLGSPVAGQTIASWQDDFFTAGYPGSAYPAFYSPVGSTTLWPSIRWYNETNTNAVADSGLVGVSSSSQGLSTGKGFYTWCGDNLATTAAFTVDVTGPPNIAHTPLTLPMSYTSSGTLAADGWNLVSNPLPSPINFTLVTFGANVAHQYWIFDPASGNTLSWSAGVGQGGLNGKIQSSQGFWLKANGPSVTTTVAESAKVLEALNGGIFGGDLQAVLPILRFKVSSTMNTFSDEATLVLDQGSPELDSLDAPKMVLHTNGAPGLALLSSDGQELSIDFGGALGPDISIPLRVKAEVSGNYTINISSTVQSLSCITLEDLSTGTLTPLTDGASYSFYTDSTTNSDTPRFLIHGTTSLPLTITDPTCADATGQAAVSIADMPMDIVWTTAYGDTLSQQSGVANSTALLGDLPPGNYAIHAGPVEACGMLSADFSITAPSALEIDTLSSSPTTCANGVDGSLHLQVLGGSGSATCVWDDGTVGLDLFAGAGAHEAIVTDSLGCTASATFIIPAGGGATAGFTAAAAFVGVPADLINTSQMSTAWLWDFGDGTTSEDNTPEHSWSEPGIYNVSLIATDGSCSDQFAMDILVDVSTVVADASDPRVFAAWANQENIVILHPFGKQPVEVNVIDATGRTALSLSGYVGPDRIEIPDQALPAGIWFVRISSGDQQHTFRVPLIR